MIAAIALAIVLAPYAMDAITFYHLKSDAPAAWRAPSSLHSVETVVSDVVGLIPGAAPISIPLALVSIMSKHPAMRPMVEGQTSPPQHGWIGR